MRRLRAAIVRLADLFRAGGRAGALRRELESHLQLHIDDNLRAGMTPTRRAARALLKLGGVESARQATASRSTVPASSTLCRTWFRRAPAAQLTGLHRDRYRARSGSEGRPRCRSMPSSMRPSSGRCPTPSRGGWSTRPRPRRRSRMRRSRIPDYLDWKRLNTVFSALEAHNGGRMSLRRRRVQSWRPPPA